MTTLPTVYRFNNRCNFNEPITRDSLDYDNYRLKFELYHQLLSSNDARLLGLMSDPTINLYSNFKLNNRPLQLYAYQDMIINDPHRFIYFRAANQIGKSMLLDCIGVHNLLTDHGLGFNTAIVSKSLDQSRFQMRRIKDILNSCSLDWYTDKGSTDNMSIVSYSIKDNNGTVQYTNLIICVPCTEGLLGYDLHRLMLDEFEFWDIDPKYFFNQIAQPRTYSTKGSILILSNPNGQDHYGATLEHQRLLDGTRKWHVYVFNYLDKPGNTMDEYLQLKHELDRAQFESTVDAVRTLSSNNYFTPNEIEHSLDHDLTQRKEICSLGKQTFWFLDVGSVHDQCVLCGCYVEPDLHDDKFKHVYLFEIKVYPVGYPISLVVGAPVSDDLNLDKWHYEKPVKDYLLEHSINNILPVFGCDVTGNSGISPLFQAIGVNPIDIVFSGPKKSAMYSRFKYFMEKGLLHRIQSKDWDHQARRLYVKRSIRGYLMIHHESESDRDDCMDATAGVINLADNPDNVPIIVNMY